MSNTCRCWKRKRLRSRNDHDKQQRLAAHLAADERGVEGLVSEADPGVDEVVALRRLLDAAEPGLRLRRRNPQSSSSLVVSAVAAAAAEEQNRANATACRGSEAA